MVQKQASTCDHRSSRVQPIPAGPARDPSPPRLFPKHLRFSPFLLNYQRNGTPTVSNRFKRWNDDAFWDDRDTQRERERERDRVFTLVHDLSSFCFFLFLSLSFSNASPFLPSKHLFFDSIEFFLPSPSPVRFFLLIRIPARIKEKEMYKSTLRKIKIETSIVKRSNDFSIEFLVEIE